VSNWIAAARLESGKSCSDYLALRVTLDANPVPSRKRLLQRLFSREWQCPAGAIWLLPICVKTRKLRGPSQRFAYHRR
jgi:hypothetical protein